MEEVKKTFVFPSGFSSKRAPRRDELEALWNWLYTNYHSRDKKVLEFGSGITSWVLNDALNPKLHVCVEQFPISVENVIKQVPSVQIITRDWSNIPKYDYDILFVDSSTGAPKDLKSLDIGGIFRHDAIHYVRDMITKDAIVIIHDWNHKPRWMQARKYLESNGYGLLWSYASKYGFGAYQKGDIL